MIFIDKGTYVDTDLLRRSVVFSKLLRDAYVPTCKSASSSSKESDLSTSREREIRESELDY